MPQQKHISCHTAVLVVYVPQQQLAVLMYVEFSKPYLLRARSALKKRKKKMRSTLELYNESASLFSSFFFSIYSCVVLRA